MKVLLAIDGSEESIEAAAFLARLPLREKPTVSVLTVLEDQSNMEIPMYRSETEENETATHFETIQSVLQRVGYELSFITKRGHPSWTIISVAKEIDADLIVMGARGHSAIYRVILGSTANFVANNAQCSVVVVRPDADKDDAAPDFSVLLAYDGSQFSRTASQQMFELDWSKTSAKIDIAMMLPRPKLVPVDLDYDPDAIADANRTLPTLSSERPCQCDISYTVRETLHVGSTLWDLADAKKTNLMFVGAAGKSALIRFFLGSTSRYLLNHLACSIWIARKKDWEQKGS